MKKHYKIGIIGFGSIGKRHLKNLVRYLNDMAYSYTIDLIRHSKETDVTNEYKEYITSCKHIEDELCSDYDILFVTNPTHLHYDTIKQFSHNTVHMFIEKPVFDHVNYDLDKLHLKDNSVYYVACPLRYTDVIQYVKASLSKWQIFSVRAICSSYLPDWRPDQDYRENYCSKAGQGGGVSIDLIHEWDYITYLFGLPQTVNYIGGKYSNLEIDSDDIGIYIGQYEKMLVELHLDYFGRTPVRQLEILSSEDTIVADLINSQITFKKANKVVRFDENRDGFQLKEIEYFFSIINKNVTNSNTIANAITTLNLTKGVC